MPAPPQPPPAALRERRQTTTTPLRRRNPPCRPFSLSSFSPSTPDPISQLTTTTTTHLRACRPAGLTSSTPSLPPYSSPPLWPQPATRSPHPTTSCSLPCPTRRGALPPKFYIARPSRPIGVGHLPPDTGHIYPGRPYWSAHWCHPQGRAVIRNRRFLVRGPRWWMGFLGNSTAPRPRKRRTGRYNSDGRVWCLACRAFGRNNTSHRQIDLLRETLDIGLSV